MNSEHERDPFEFFGDIETDVAPVVARAEPPRESPVRLPKPATSAAAIMSGLAAPLWLAGAAGAAFAYFGADIVYADPSLLAAIGAGVVAPALLFWSTSAAAADAANARKLAAELMRMARESRLPFEAGHAEARDLGDTVRTELGALNDAVAAALNRFAALEETARRSASLFGDTVDASQDQVAAMTAALRGEREALLSVNADLRGQTEAVAENIGRQVRLMREASKIVKSEIVAAEAALEAHAQRFSETASAVAEQTESFQDVADHAASVASSLNGTLAEMLDSMSEATRLADAARKSSEQAVMAANHTAGALRETTRTAVEEAQRAAQMMRVETQAIQNSAADTLAQLRDAAYAARAASEESQAAANRHAATAEKRTRREAPATLFAAAEAARTRRGERAPEAPQRRHFMGFGNWGNFSAHTPQDSNPTTANEHTDLMSFAREEPALRIDLRDEALELVLDAGVALDDVLRTSDLERIARCSRDGASARRAAVRDAAPGAVIRIARYVRHNTKAHKVANEFRARPDLAKSEGKQENSSLVRAYLLIDAALA